MTYILSLVIILFTSFSPLWASTLQTNTHFYLLDAYVQGILAIDRKTNTEKVIPLAQVPRWMVIHDDFGYAFSKYNGSNLFVINLKTNVTINTIKLPEMADSMCFYNTTGYLLSSMSDQLIPVDLKTHKLLPTIPVGRSPMQLLLHDAMGYSVNYFSQDVSVINLKTNQVTDSIYIGSNISFTILHKDKGYITGNDTSSVSVIDLKFKIKIKSIPVGLKPDFMVIQGEVGYVLNSGSGTLSVIDLKTNTVTHTIPVGEMPTSMLIHGGMGYITYKTSPILSVLDLKTNTITHTIPVHGTGNLKIHGHVGYVCDDDRSFVVFIDLTTDTVISRVNNHYRKNVNFTDTHVYFGHEKICPHFKTMGNVQDLIMNKTLGMHLKTLPFLGTLSPVDPLDGPDAPTFLDDLPLDEALESLKPWENDGEAYLVFLKMLHCPKRITGSAPWNNHIRYGIYTTFFRALGVNNQRKAQEILTSLIQVGDTTLASLFSHTGQMDADTQDDTQDALTDDDIPAKNPPPNLRERRGKKGKKGKKKTKKK